MSFLSSSQRQQLLAVVPLLPLHLSLYPVIPEAASTPSLAHISFFTHPEDEGKESWSSGGGERRFRTAVSRWVGFFSSLLFWSREVLKHYTTCSPVAAHLD